MSSHLLTPTDTAEQLAGSTFVHLDGSLYATFTTKDFASASELVAQVARAADALNHHPDIALGWGKVSFELSSHDAGGVTSRDLKLAAEIQKLADSLGATGQQVRPTRYEMAIDCVECRRHPRFLARRARLRGARRQRRDPTGRPARRRADDLVPAHGSAAHRPKSHPSGRIRADGRCAGPRRCGHSGWRRFDDRRARPGLVGARRCRRQRTVRVHLGTLGRGNA